MRTNRAFMDEGTKLFLAAVERLDEGGWDAPSLLPGWRARQVVAHVHLNAEALQRLAHWARTGIETPMYTSRKQRDRDIAELAQASPSELMVALRTSAEALSRDLDGLTAEQCERTVLTSQGESISASRIPWLRAREVAVHAVDLDVGLDFTHLADDLLAELVRDVVEFRLQRDEGATLATWLTGRLRSGMDLRPWI